MLADLFKPAWKSSSVEKRMKAVSAMDDASSENQKVLAQLAADDEDISICIAAIQKLTSATVLHEISIKHASDPVRVEAEKRLNELMASLDKDQCHDLLSRYPELAVRIAAHADISSVRTEAIQNLNSNQLLQVLGQTVYSDARQLIAEKLTDIEALESARKILRGKDKNAERILKTKIDEFRKQQQQLAENLAAVEKLCEEVEYLVSHDWRSEFKAKLLVNRQHWDSLDFEIDPDSSARYQTARKIIDSRFEQQNIIEQTLQSQQQLLVELEAFLHDIKGRDITGSIELVSETLSRQDQFNSSWQQLAVKIQPDLATQNQFDSMLSALQSAGQLIVKAADILQQETTTGADESEGPAIVAEQIGAEQIEAGQTRDDDKLAENSKILKTALKELKWPSIYGELQLATELQAQLTDWFNQQKASAAEYKQKLDLTHKKISSIFRFSRTGNLARARQYCERVEKALNQFAGKDRLALEERFEEARKTLEDMGDWKNFATEPKYVELCEAMELLASSKHHPDKLSNEVKDLQQRWKKLGHSDISEQYWPRFKQAADNAYQPCAEFFDQRHKVRKANLEQRQQYVEQMHMLFEETDWDNSPDYKAVQNSVRNISNNFTSIKEVEYKAGQKQWKQFSKARDEVMARLDVAYEANIKLKRDLVKQAEALAEAAVKEENLLKLKTLQSRWKQIGITRRKEDQKAWVEFKKHGDTVFNKVQELRDGQRAKTDQQLNAYREIIKDIQKLASTADDLAEADHLFADLQAQYTDLPELPAQLPEKLVEGIQHDYRNACDQFDECRSRIINSKRRQQIEALRQKANLCAQLEALDGSPAEEHVQQISQQWDAIELHDPVLSSRIDERRNSAQAVIDRATITAERRMLCIKLEIATGTESPDEDKELRMQYQLEQMNKSGLGQQTVNSNEQLESIEIDWLCMPGAEPEQQKELDQRFLRALRAG